MITLPIIGNLPAQRRLKSVHRIDLAENAGTPADARVLLKDTDSNGTLLADVRIKAGESRHLEFRPPLRFPNGVYVQVTAGTVRGSVTGT